MVDSREGLPESNQYPVLLFLPSPGTTNLTTAGLRLAVTSRSGGFRKEDRWKLPVSRSDESAEVLLLLGAIQFIYPTKDKPSAIWPS